MTNTPFIFTLIKRCKHHGVPYALMCRLNYTDLLALMVEYDIEELLVHFKKLEKERLAEQGVTIREASNSEILRK